METTQIVADEGLKVRPVTLLVAERLRERHISSLDTGVTADSETATHCVVASSVNNRVPF